MAAHNLSNFAVHRDTNAGLRQLRDQVLRVNGSYANLLDLLTQSQHPRRDALSK